MSSENNSEFSSPGLFPSICWFPYILQGKVFFYLKKKIKEWKIKFKRIIKLSEKKQEGTSSYDLIKENFTLDIRLPNNRSQRIIVRDKIVLGSDVAADLNIPEIESTVFIFRLQNKILTLHNKGNHAFIGNQPLEENRMYIVTKGEKIEYKGEKLSFSIIIRQSDLDKEKETELGLDLDIPTNESNQDINLDIDNTFYPDMEIDKEEDKKQNEKEKEDKKENKKEKQEKKELVNVEQVLKIDKKDEQRRRKSRKKEKKKFKKKESTRQKIAFVDNTYQVGILMRLYFLIVNFCIVYGIIQYGISYFDKDQIVNKVMVQYIVPSLNEAVKLLLPHLPASMKSFTTYISPPILLWPCVFIAWDSMMHLIFGVSFPSFIAGIKSTRGLLISRIQGLFRVVIGYITLWLLVFDLPVLFGNRPFKEMMTATRFTRASTVRRWFSLGFLFPLLILVGLFSPFLHDISTIKGLPMDTHLKVSPVKKTAKQSLISHTYGVHFSPFPDKIHFIPRFSKNTRPYLSVVDISQKQPIDWRIKEKTLTPFIEKTRQGYFSIPQSLPKKIPTSFSINQQEEILHLLTACLSLDAILFFDFVFKYGPFINGCVQGKSYLIKSLNLMPNDSFTFYKSDLGHWMTIHSNSMSQSQLISLKYPNRPLWDFSYSKESEMYVIKELIPMMKGLEKDFKIINKRDFQWNPFSLVDTASRNLPFSQKKRFLNNAKAYYKKTIKEVEGRSNLTALWKKSQHEFIRYMIQKR